MSSLLEMEDRGRKLAIELAGKVLTSDGAATVLDVGCGSGWFIRELTARYPHLEGWGVDPFGREYHSGRMHCLRAGADEIDSLGPEFDLISTVMSLHHFPSVRAFVRSAVGALRAGTGRLLIVDWMCGVDTGIPEDYFSLEEIVDILEAEGWRVVQSGRDTWHFFIVARLPSGR